MRTKLSPRGLCYIYRIFYAFSAFAVLLHCMCCMARAYTFLYGFVRVFALYAVLVCARIRTYWNNLFLLWVRFARAAPFTTASLRSCCAPAAFCHIFVVAMSSLYRRVLYAVPAHTARTHTPHNFCARTCILPSYACVRAHARYARIAGSSNPTPPHLSLRISLFMPACYCNGL